LKAGETMIADQFEAVTVLFADIVDFTLLAGETSPEELVCTLNELFSIFDQVTQQHNLEKIKTSGDAYIIASGLPLPRRDHAQALAAAALELRQQVQSFSSSRGKKLQMRFGMHSGPVTAGVIGSTKFIYDLWGDTVNTASRMESLGIPGEIQISAATCELLKDQYLCEARGAIEVKGKGEVQAYLLVARL
jgi:class 3 adenylate cyclase